MASNRFSVGQRVRFIGTHVEVPRGVLGNVIASLAHHRPDVYGKARSYGIAFDDVPPHKGNLGWACLPRDLEPVYDGNTPVAWAECAWQPPPTAQHPMEVRHG